MPRPKKVDDSLKIEITCSITGEVKRVDPKADGSPSLPMGWKEIQGNPVSPAGYQQSYFTTCPRIAIASVALGFDPDDWPTNEEAKEAWRVFRDAATDESRDCRTVLNGVVRQLAIEDSEPVTRGENGKFKLPPAPKGAGAYGAMRAMVPDINSQVVGSLVQKAKSRYSEDRFEVRVRGSKSLSSFRDRVPIPNPDAVLYVGGVNNQLLLVKATIRGQRFTFRLQAGDRWRRQVQNLREALTAGRVGEISFMEKPIHDGGNAAPKAFIGKGPGRNRVPTRWMIAIPVTLPKKKHERDGILALSTGGGAFWRVAINGEPQPPYHELQALRWGKELERRLGELPVDIEQHADRLQSFADDQKHDRRFPRRERPDIQGAREKAVRVHANRVDDLCKKLCRSIVLLCQRRRIGTVVYDDIDASYLSSFGWFRLRTMLGNKLKEIGVCFEVVEHEDETDNSEVPESQDS